MYHKLKKLYPELIAGVDFTLQDDGEGAYISSWNSSSPKPTAEQLAAVSNETGAVVQVIAQYTAAIQSHLDRFARARGYDSILSAATYATSSVPKFAAEGQYAVGARDATWAKCYEILAAVEARSRPMPTLAEITAELPALAWPA